MSEATSEMTLEIRAKRRLAIKRLEAAKAAGARVPVIKDLKGIVQDLEDQLAVLRKMRKKEMGITG